MVPVLAFFVALGAATAIYLMRQEAPTHATQAVEAEEVLEITPALPRISLLPDSVPGEEHDPEELGESGSLLDGFEWHDQKERRERLERSLAEIVQDVQGLGVLVEPAKDTKEEKR